MDHVTILRSLGNAIMKFHIQITVFFYSVLFERYGHAFKKLRYVAES